MCREEGTWACGGAGDCGAVEGRDPMKPMPCSLPFCFRLLQIMERALFHMDNCYNIPNVRGTGRLCKTNLASNTAFRGFGGPQGMLIAEHWMSEVAVTCGLPAEDVSRELGGTSRVGYSTLRDSGFAFWASPWGAEERQVLTRGAQMLQFRFCPPRLLPPRSLSVSLPAKVRRKNMYKEGDRTHFNQKLEGFTLVRCWDECLESSQYHSRKTEIDKFNK